MSIYVDEAQLAKRLQEIRYLKKLTAQDVANMTGLHRVLIGKLESGHREIRYREAVLIAEALGVDLRTLITDEPMTVATEVHVI